ncbi:glycosyltransferase family 4 protein [Parasporobacterium paucivorans]|nr:glycosyltransferase family 4 protein [Parasporobacterium paucivorans]
MQKLIEKSGVGRAIYHQKMAADMNRISCTDGLADADVVHINTVFPKSLWIACRAHQSGIPVIFHAHSTKEDFKNSYLGSNLFDGLFGIWIKHCYSHGDMIVTPSEYSKQLLESYGIKKEIHVISNGIDLEYYRKTEDESERMAFRSKYGYSKEDKIIMSVGLMIGRKGLPEFVELARRFPKYKFIWFGESNLHTVPKKIRDAVRTELPNLQFAGYVPKSELKRAYEHSDLFLFPSYEETEGIVVLEALAMKIPILLRDIPVYDSWLVDGRDVYKAADTEEFEIYIRNILEDKIENLAEQGYEVAKQRDISIVGNELRRIYAKALDRKMVSAENCLSVDLTHRDLRSKI